MATGNIKISELTHLSEVHGTERIPVSWKAPGSSYFESYSVSTAELSTYIDTAMSISSSLRQMQENVDSTYTYVTNSVAALSYDVTYMQTQVQEAVEVTSVLNETIEEIGGVEPFKEAIEELTYVTGDVEELKSYTSTLQEDVLNISSYVTTLQQSTMKGTIKPAETTSTDMTNFTCDKELANGEQYTRIIRNNGNDPITVALSTTQGYATPDGQPINLTIKAGGYGEFNFMKSDNIIFVRAL